MTRTKPISSTTDAYAKRIARSIAKGKLPSFDDGIEQYCDSSPNEIYSAFAGVARHMPPAGKDESLAIGYLFLLQRLLEHLRYRTDRGYVDAAKLIADFQADVVARVAAGKVDGTTLVFVGGALHQAKIPVSSEFAKTSEAYSVGTSEDASVPSDVRTALAGVVKACGEDPFSTIGSLLEVGHAMPPETRAELARALALSGIPATRAAAVLFLLDSESLVRCAVAEALAKVATALTPVDLRRLVAMRNWRPVSELAAVDALIRKTRAAEIDCAQWEAGGIEEIFATVIDAATAQGFLLISPTGNKKQKRLSSILTKGGIADAGCGKPESRQRIDAFLADAEMAAPMVPVSRSYLDRWVTHHLALSTDKGDVPPLGLLQVAESIGGADWQPTRMAFETAIAALIAELPKAMRDPAAVASVLRDSGELVDVEAVAQSWFEDDPQIANVMARSDGNRARLATYLLQNGMARYRDKWADVVLRTALMMREVSERGLCWRELAIVAKALADGHDMSEIGLMRAIALRTIAAFKDRRRMQGAA